MEAQSLSGLPSSWWVTDSGFWIPMSWVHPTVLSLWYDVQITQGLKNPGHEQAGKSSVRVGAGEGVILLYCIGAMCLVPVQEQDPGKFRGEA